MESVDAMTSEIERLFTAKEERRKELAALPYADKVRIVIQLQRMAAPILRRRGRDVTVWSLRNRELE
ncbi:MAG: hypothetical protein EHM23_18360 [Acidobacteria bacterium]|nr:MAG: hypothetical protein EHM23_18360 [Acidobacteriota bacterium]